MSSEKPEEERTEQPAAAPEAEETPPTSQETAPTESAQAPSEPAAVGEQAAETESSTAEAAPRTRSPVERLVVWGLILVLIVLVGLEAWARLGYKRSFDQISAALQKAEESDDDLTLAEAEELLVMNPKKGEIQQEGLNKTVVFTWRGVFRTYRLKMVLGVDDIVLEISDAG